MSQPLGWIMLIGILVAVAASFLLLPIRAGQFVRGPQDPQSPRTAFDWFKGIGSCALMLIVWFVVVASTSILRVYVSMPNDTTTDQNTKRDSFASLGAALRTLFTNTEATWMFAIYLAIGLFIIFAHARENPYYDTAVSANRKIKRANRLIDQLEQERDHSDAELALSHFAAKKTDDSYQLMIDDTLPTWEKLLVELYRRVYAEARGDAQITALLLLAQDDDGSYGVGRRGQP